MFARKRCFWAAQADNRVKKTRGIHVRRFERLFGGWCHPQAYAEGGLKLKRWIEFARIMERGRLDMLFIADKIGMSMTDSTTILG